ncbi:hypothetical protein ACLOJK_028287, partial [Asimina triloba]
ITELFKAGDEAGSKGSEPHFSLLVKGGERLEERGSVRLREREGRVVCKQSAAATIVFEEKATAREPSSSPQGLGASDVTTRGKSAEAISILSEEPLRGREPPFSWFERVGYSSPISRMEVVQKGVSDDRELPKKSRRKEVLTVKNS